METHLIFVANRPVNIRLARPRFRATRPDGVGHTKSIYKDGSIIDLSSIENKQDQQLLILAEDPFVVQTNMATKIWMTICDLLPMPVLSPPTVRRRHLAHEDRLTDTMIVTTHHLVSGRM